MFKCYIVSLLRNVLRSSLKHSLHASNTFQGEVDSIMQSHLVYLKLAYPKTYLIYLTLHCESPSLLSVQFTLMYPTPGLSDTFYEEQTWSDK